MAVFSTDVVLRWSDMDAYGHVNNARVATLLEEARAALLFAESARSGAESLADGVVVVELLVRYHRPLVYSATPVRVRLWVSELRSASFSLEYTMTAGDGDAVTARTRLVAYDLAAQRSRRLTPAEREFLTAFREE